MVDSDSLMLFHTRWNRVHRIHSTIANAESKAPNSNTYVSKHKTPKHFIATSDIRCRVNTNGWKKTLLKMVEGIAVFSAFEPPHDIHVLGGV